MDPTTGPCATWPVTGCTGSEAATGVAVEAATEVLWAFSGRQFGFCDVTLRPCLRGCVSGSQWEPWWWAGDWSYPDRALVEVACGACGDSCSCASFSMIRLPGLVHEIVSVSIDGATLDADAYWLRNGRDLIRTDGETWPSCQDWRVESGEGVFEVVARFGEPVPAIGQLAAAELAQELAYLCDGSDECRLPATAIEVTRGGVTYNIGLYEALMAGNIGLTHCAFFLATYNPNGLRRAPRVYSPDI